MPVQLDRGVLISIHSIQLTPGLGISMGELVLFPFHQVMFLAELPLEMLCLPLVVVPCPYSQTVIPSVQPTFYKIEVPRHDGEDFNLGAHMPLDILNNAFPFGYAGGIPSWEVGADNIQSARRAPKAEDGNISRSDFNPIPVFDNGIEFGKEVPTEDDANPRLIGLAIGPECSESHGEA